MFGRVGLVGLSGVLARSNIVASVLVALSTETLSTICAGLSSKSAKFAISSPVTVILELVIVSSSLSSGMGGSWLPIVMLLRRAALGSIDVTSSVFIPLQC